MVDPSAPEPIDPLRAMEAGLLEHRALLESVFDFVESQVFVKDLDGRYVVANKQIEIESGIPHDEMIGRTDRELFPDADVDTWRANDLAVVEGGEAVRVEEQFERPDGMQTFLSMKFPCRTATAAPTRSPASPRTSPTASGPRSRRSRPTGRRASSCRA